MHRRRKLAWLVVLVVGLALIPAAGASASKKSEQKQNKAIATVAKAVKKVSTDLATLNSKVNDQGTKIDDLNTKANGIDGRLKTIEAGVPAVIDGLGQLKTGLETAGAGLTKLKTLATSDEYVVARVLVGGTALPGCFITTPNVPDNGNQVTAAMTCVNPPSGTPLTGALTVEAACRTAESDGTSATDPCAQAGIVSLTSSNIDTGTGAAVFGGNISSKPNATLGGAPIYDIATKSPLFSTTDTSFPLAMIATDNKVDLTTGANSAGAAASTPDATHLGLIQISIRALDRTPSADDPSA